MDNPNESILLTDDGHPIGEVVKKMQAKGLKVKILTARVAPRDMTETKPNPYLENHWCTKPHDGICEALLMAEYAKRMRP